MMDEIEVYVEEYKEILGNLDYNSVQINVGTQHAYFHHMINSEMCKQELGWLNFFYLSSLLLKYLFDVSIL